MTIPNIITFFRFILAGLLAFLFLQFSESGLQEYRYWALGVFLLAALSDFADGFIARRTGSTSKWGAVMDPLADKLLTLIVLFFLAWIPSLRVGLNVPLFYIFALLVVLREFCILAGILILKLLRKQVAISPSQAGKLCTAFQFLTLASLISGVGKYGNIFILLSCAFVLYSGITYVTTGWKILKEKNLLSQ